MQLPTLFGRLSNGNEFLNVGAEFATKELAGIGLPGLKLLDLFVAAGTAHVNLLLGNAEGHGEFRGL